MDQTVRVPVVVVSSDTAQATPASTKLAIVTRTTVRNVIERRGQLNEPVEIVILDMHAANRTDVIIAGLLLRNAGRTVIVTGLTKLPIELVHHLHEFSVQEKSAGRSVRTELLFMEDAMKVFGEIGDVVTYFEREFLLE